MVVCDFSLASDPSNAAGSAILISRSQVASGLKQRGMLVVRDDSEQGNFHGVCMKPSANRSCQAQLTGLSHKGMVQWPYVLRVVRV